MEVKVHNLAGLPLIDYRELNPLQGNLKDLHQKDYEKLRKSMSERGFLFPFFVWFNPEDEKPYLIDGHGRHRVCRTENVQPYELPYVQIPGENREEAKKNLLVATSQYQRITQEGLDEFAFDLENEWLADFTSFAGVFDFEEEAKELEEKSEIPSITSIPVSVIEDVYELVSIKAGITHKIRCGDSLENSYFSGATITATDPPHDFDLSQNQTVLNNSITASERDIFFHTGNRQLLDLVKENEELFHDFFVHDFVFHIGGGSGPLRQYDLIGHFRKTKFFNRNDGFSNLVRVNSMRMGGYTNQIEHDHQKHVELPAKFIEHYTEKGESVYDPFLGSGTTLIACEKLGRTCYGQELDEKNMDIIVSRWVRFMQDNDKEYEVRRNGVTINWE